LMPELMMVSSAPDFAPSVSFKEFDDPLRAVASLHGGFLSSTKQV